MKKSQNAEKIFGSNCPNWDLPKRFFQVDFPSLAKIFYPALCFYFWSLSALNTLTFMQV